MPKPKPKPIDSLSDGLRRVILARDLSAYALAHASGVSASSISRFLARDRSLSLASADRLTSALGLTLAEGRGGLR